MRTQDDIVNIFKKRRDRDFLGFELTVYTKYLDSEHAKKLNPDVDKDKWDSTPALSPTKENILDEMLKYMPFAWEKANECRGISANRSIDHYRAWLWLLDDDSFLEKFESIQYQHYGKEMLIAICEKFGWDWKQWDNGERTNWG